MSRLPISSIPEQHLEPIQRGTLVYEWKGILCLKNPFDLALYLRLLWQVKPATLIEIGSYSGGSAAWFADMTAAMGLETNIISIDVTPPTLDLARVQFRQGSAARLDAVLKKAELDSLPRPWLVIDDASHRYEDCAATLRFFEPLLRPGEYICVEDGIVDSFGVADRYEGGPNRAIQEFLHRASDRFEIDTGYCDYFGFNATWNTNGFIRCKVDGLAPEDLRARQHGLGFARVEVMEVHPSHSGEQCVSLRCRAHQDITGLRVLLCLLDGRGEEIGRAQTQCHVVAWEGFILRGTVSGALPQRCGIRVQLHTADGEEIDSKLMLIDVNALGGSGPVNVRLG